MNKFLSILAIASVTALAIQLPSEASPKKSYIGPAYSFSGLTGIGATGRFSVAENISIRPHVGFSSFGTSIGANATYDFEVPGSKITPYVGAGFQTGGLLSGITYGGGADYEISESMVLNANLSLNGLTTIGVGLGFQF